MLQQQIADVKRTQSQMKADVASILACVQTLSDHIKLTHSKQSNDTL